MHTNRLFFSLCSAIAIFLPMIAQGQSEGPSPAPPPAYGENERQLRERDGSADESMVVQRITHSPFAKAYFTIYNDSFESSAFIAGVRHAQHGHTTPPGVLRVCFVSLVKDTLTRYSGNDQFGRSCANWNDLGMEIIPDKGMTLSYDRRGHSELIENAVLAVPKAEDAEAWKMRAKKAEDIYGAAFDRERSARQVEIEKMKREEEVRRATLDTLRQQPIVVYPE